MRKRNENKKILGSHPSPSNLFNLIFYYTFEKNSSLLYHLCCSCKCEDRRIGHRGPKDPEFRAPENPEFFFSQLFKRRRNLWIQFLDNHSTHLHEKQLLALLRKSWGQWNYHNLFSKYVIAKVSQILAEFWPIFFHCFICFLISCQKYVKVDFS
jgi:hypothetical protein